LNTFARKISYNTLKNYFSALTTFYEFLEFEGYIDRNHVPSIRSRYVRRLKDNYEGQMRKLISIEEMARLINSIMDIRDKAIVTLSAKTGIRRSELIKLDLDDIDWVEQSIRPKPTPKRTNRTVFFDDETALILHRWVRARESPTLKAPKLYSSTTKVHASIEMGSISQLQSQQKRSACTTHPQIVWRITSAPTAAATGLRPTCVGLVCQGSSSKS
jgi:integrase